MVQPEPTPAARSCPNRIAQCRIRLPRRPATYPSRPGPPQTRRTIPAPGHRDQGLLPYDELRAPSAVELADMRSATKQWPDEQPPKLGQRLSITFMHALTVRLSPSASMEMFTSLLRESNQVTSAIHAQPELKSIALTRCLTRDSVMRTIKKKNTNM